jgi:dihydroorotate dehydrogenase
VTAYRWLARPVLFRMGAEAAHERTLRALSVLARSPRLVTAGRRLAGPRDPVTVFGVGFPGRVGVAGGLDKNGVALPAWAALGFGFVEVGTVTRHAQPGNPRPRLFRLPASEAVINRMGFNNDGAAALAERLKAWGPLPVPLGISLGKSKVTPIEDAVGDYVHSLRTLHPFADYFAINVSSPNTPGLRSLQDRGQLSALLAALRREGDALAGPGRPSVPLLVKLAPDLTEPAIAELLDVCTQHGVAGIIATNTTLSRDGASGPHAAEAGGLSGRPLGARALEVVRFIAAETGGALPIVGVGGILSADDAARMFDAGASLVQLYTGLVYRGPSLVRAINHRAVHSRPQGSRMNRNVEEDA